MTSAFKFLRAGAVGPYSGFRWPTPSGDGPGAWVESEAALCATGVHGCLTEHLPFWLQAELWEVELDGHVSHGRHKLVAERGRLRRRVEAWDDDARDDYAHACLERLAELAADRPEAAGYAADGSQFAEAGEAAVVAFVTARAAELASGPEAYDAERARQARWLAERLGL